ncbi:MAG: histidine phosphatase family protein [Bryobacteraceae bacterium]|nr:histidine phosphatase family protein [Bryobacteraceae bacterium]
MLTVTQSVSAPAVDFGGAVPYGVVSETRNLPPATVWLIRHGETEWSISGQHSGRTDLPLTAKGEDEAREARELLAGRSFDVVLCSPLRRARRTCQLAGYLDVADIEPDCQEWDYGDWTGYTQDQIREKSPDWTIWTGPVPGGESLEDIASRAKRVVNRIRNGGGTAAIFAHGHFLRVFTTQWLGLPAATGGNFALETSGICILGEDAGLPAIRAWNLRRSLTSPVAAGVLAGTGRA